MRGQGEEINGDGRAGGKRNKKNEKGRQKKMYQSFADILPLASFSFSFVFFFDAGKWSDASARRTIRTERRRQQHGNNKWRQPKQKKNEKKPKKPS